jgi:hypothetical protein
MHAILLAQVSDVIRRKPASSAGAKIDLGSEKIEFKRSRKKIGTPRLGGPMLFNALIY